MNPLPAALTKALAPGADPAVLPPAVYAAVRWADPGDAHDEIPEVDDERLLLAGCALEPAVAGVVLAHHSHREAIARQVLPTCGPHELVWALRTLNSLPGDREGDLADHPGIAAVIARCVDVILEHGGVNGGAMLELVTLIFSRLDEPVQLLLRPLAPVAAGLDRRAGETLLSRLDLGEQVVGAAGHPGCAAAIVLNPTASAAARERALSELVLTGSSRMLLRVAPHLRDAERRRLACGLRSDLGDLASPLREAFLAPAGLLVDADRARQLPPSRLTQLLHDGRASLEVCEVIARRAEMSRDDRLRAIRQIFREGFEGLRGTDDGSVLVRTVQWLVSTTRPDGTCEFGDVGELWPYLGYLVVGFFGHEVGDLGELEFEQLWPWVAGVLAQPRSNEEIAAALVVGGDIIEQAAQRLDLATFEAMCVRSDVLAGWLREQVLALSPHQLATLVALHDDWTSTMAALLETAREVAQRPAA